MAGNIVFQFTAFFFLYVGEKNADIEQFGPGIFLDANDDPLAGDFDRLFVRLSGYEHGDVKARHRSDELFGATERTVAADIAGADDNVRILYRNPYLERQNLLNPGRRTSFGDHQTDASCFAFFSANLR